MKNEVVYNVGAVEYINNNFQHRQPRLTVLKRALAVLENAYISQERLATDGGPSEQRHMDVACERFRKEPIV